MESTGRLPGCPSIDALRSGGREISLHLAGCADCRIALKMLPDPVLEASETPEPIGVEGTTGSFRARPPRSDGAATHPPLPERYEDLGPLGLGGMGEVRRVRDRVLGRVLAMKLISTTSVGNATLSSRFLEEARVASQLEHPAMVPVHDVGQLCDGRLYFTMREIKGRTLSEAIDDQRHGEGDWTLRRLVEVLVRVSEAVAFAHERGVVHRDLKPANVMVGAHGEVWVLDWGLAKPLGEAAVGGGEAIPTAGAVFTGVGAVVGTPAYMAPEQAAGERERIGPSTDVYGLGATLYQMLTGTAPYRGRTVAEVLQQVHAGPPPPPTGPEVLVDLCRQAMLAAPERRPSGAAEVAARLRRWLDGTQRRAEAEGIVALAREEDLRAAHLLERVSTLRREAARLLEDVPRWAGEEAKAAGWRLQDEARRVQREATLAGIAAEQRLIRALQVDETCLDAHAALLERCLASHRAAEGDRDHDAAAVALAKLSPHLAALPEHHPARISATTYLRGDGALTLVTEPAGAEVLLYRYELHHRRLVEVFDRSLGTTPLREVPLPMGSYLCVVRAEGRAEVRYPVRIERQQHWDGVPPGGSEPHPIALPGRGELSDDERYVPAGWFWAGGDPRTHASLPRQRVWVDAVVIDRLSVTNQQYIAFLDDLVRRGRREEALRFAPRERGGRQDEQGSVIYGFDGARFFLRRDADGDAWLPRYPVTQVDWFCGEAYASWRAERTGRPWRLPGELEWEKAARGVDGRFFPWGDAFDPSWCCMSQSHAGSPHPCEVGAHAADRSPYGVGDMAGCAFNWCADVYVVDGCGAPSRADPADRSSRRVVRGGSWGASPVHSRSATRNWNQPMYRGGHGGLRLVRSLAAGRC